MDNSTFSMLRLYFLSAVTLAIWTILLWDHFHGGVSGHHLLARADLPSFSNWWGGVLIPLFSFLMFHKIEKRLFNGITENNKKAFNTLLIRFFSAFIFGIVLAILFTLGFDSHLEYMFYGVFILALIIPVYFAECCLGFVLGITYTFGGVLPIIICGVLSLITAFIYLVVRAGIIHFTKKNEMH